MIFFPFTFMSTSSFIAIISILIIAIVGIVAIQAIQAISDTTDAVATEKGHKKKTVQQAKQNTIALEQKLSDKINDAFDGFYLSCPGRGKITVIEITDTGLREYQIKPKDGAFDSPFCTYETKTTHQLKGDSLDNYRKLWNIIGDFNTKEGLARG